MAILTISDVEIFDVESCGRMARKGAWDNIITFKAMLKIDYDEPIDEITVKIEDIVGQWVSHSLTQQFVLLLTDKLIAGGCTDNKKGWDEKWNSEPQLATFELRCDDHDATFFLLKFTEKPCLI